MNADARQRLTALRTAAAEAVTRAGALRVDPVERARRARDYRTWALMRESPQRVRDLARQVIGPEAEDDPQAFADACEALTVLLAELYEGHGPDAPRRAGPAQSGQ